MITTLLHVLFVATALVLGSAILLQEGAGGGVGAALGSAGREALGHGPGAIRRVTALVATLFLLLALCIHVAAG